MNDSRPRKPKCRWYQFSLWTLLLFVVVVGVAASVLGVKMNEWREEERMRREAEKAENVRREAERMVDY